MKKHILATVTIACILGVILSPFKDHALAKFHYHPLIVVASYIVPLVIVGIPVLLMRNKKKPVGGGA